MNPEDEKGASPAEGEAEQPTVRGTRNGLAIVLEAMIEHGLVAVSESP